MKSRVHTQSGAVPASHHHRPVSPVAAQAPPLQLWRIFGHNERSAVIVFVVWTRLVPVPCHHPISHVAAQRSNMTVILPETKQHRTFSPLDVILTPKNTNIQTSLIYQRKHPICNVFATLLRHFCNTKIGFLRAFSAFHPRRFVVYCYCPRDGARTSARARRPFCCANLRARGKIRPRRREKR